jgi:hypothetical protein
MFRTRNAPGDPPGGVGEDDEKVGLVLADMQPLSRGEAEAVAAASLAPSDDEEFGFEPSDSCGLQPSSRLLLAWLLWLPPLGLLGAHRLFLRRDASTALAMALSLGGGLLTWVEDAFYLRAWARAAAWRNAGTGSPFHVHLRSANRTRLELAQDSAGAWFRRLILSLGLVYTALLLLVFLWHRRVDALREADEATRRHAHQAVYAAALFPVPWAAHFFARGAALASAQRQRPKCDAAMCELASPVAALGFALLAFVISVLSSSAAIGLFLAVVGELCALFFCHAMLDAARNADAASVEWVFERTPRGLLLHKRTAPTADPALREFVARKPWNSIIAVALREVTCQVGGDEMGREETRVERRWWLAIEESRAQTQLLSQFDCVTRDSAAVFAELARWLGCPLRMDAVAVRVEDVEGAMRFCPLDSGDSVVEI